MYAFFVALISVAFTTIYSIRMMIYVFHRDNNSDEKVFAHIHESPMIMILPLTILSVFAIFFGMVLHDYFAGKYLVNLWDDFMHINKQSNNDYLIGSVPLIVKKSPMIAIFLGCIFCILIYFLLNSFIDNLKKRLIFIINFFQNKLYIDELYDLLFVRTSFYLGKGFWKSIDIDLIDNLGPNGISRLVGSFGKNCF